MENTVIIHFQPLEKYPPIINLLDYLSSVNHKKKITVFTTKQSGSSRTNDYINANIQIVRLKSVSANSSIAKLLQYLFFYLKIFFKIAYIKPSSILYYETLSALPAYWYKTIVRKCSILIHYHEYTAPEEYLQNSIVVKYIHKQEKKLYPQANWISHTNKTRLSFFLSDEKLVLDKKKHFTMPNYPPRNWASNYTYNSLNESKPVKVIYVGALGLETMFVKEFSEFIINQNGKVIWDIYTNQFDGEAVKYLNSLNSSYIKICGNVNYYEIPKTIANQGYNVGLIMYKGHIKNYIYNAPNKLFEYLACGLDVWYPITMKGCEEFLSINSTPLVLEIDFMSNISEIFEAYLNYKKTIKKIGKQTFYCEDIYSNIVSVL